VAYLRFSVPPSGTATFDLDAVAISNAALGAAVPEPSGLALVGGALVIAAMGWLSKFRRRASAIAGGLLLVGTLAVPAGAGAIVSEDFSSDPIAAGRAVVSGSAARFSFSQASESLTAHYDTALTTARLSWPLGRTLGPSQDFRVDASFRIQSAGFLADPNEFAQVAFGLVNTASTGPDRVSGSPDADAYHLVAVDYFPNISPQFGGPTLTPTIIQSDNGSGFFNRVVFPSGSESLLDDAGESDLPRDVPLVASLTYEAASRLVTLRLTGPGGPLPINLGGGSVGQFGGPDGDPATIQVMAPPTVAFSVDAFALTLWNDPFGGETSSVRADLTFDSFAVYDSLVVPEPAGLWLALSGVGVWLVIARRKHAPW
jgi:hypothetical protein